MFERFTDRARRVVVLDQEEARLLNHNWIGTEHILLGLIHEHEGVAAKVLERMGISLEAVRDKVRAIIGEGGSQVPSGHIPFTPRSKKVLELSLREALQLGHNYIGTEHLLLGLIREGVGVGAQVLVNLGAELSAVRDEVIKQLTVYRGGPPGVRVHPSSFQGPRETPAAAKASVEARRLAGGGAVGSQHYLLGLLGEEDSMAAKALAAAGVSREAIEAKLAELDPTGTSDETPEQAGARRIGIRVEGRLLMLEIDDPELAESLEKAMAGRKVRIIKGDDPEAEAAGFPSLWSAVSRTVEDLTRSLSRSSFGGVVRPRMSTARWRPPGWELSAHAAGYWIINQPDGQSVHLEVGEGVDREAVRTWLAQWLRAWREGGLPSPGRPEEESSCATLWVTVDSAGEGFGVESFGFGPFGPGPAAPVPLETLVQAAIDDLSSPAA